MTTVSTIKSVPIHSVELLFAKEVVNHYFPHGVHGKFGFDGTADRDLIGILGELIVLKYVGGDILRHFTGKSYGRSDGNFDVKINGTKYDIKAKTIAIKPQDHHEFSVSREQLEHEGNDAYIFCFVMKDMENGFIAGMMGKDEFAVRSVYHEKGEIDPENNFTFPCNAYNIPVSALYSIDSIKRGNYAGRE